IRREAVSVEANIVEGYALDTKGLFRRHLRIAFASAAEVESLSALASELDYLSPQAAEQIVDAAGHAMRLIIGLLRSLH
ncbi:MAG: four helix bundle protein, partial [Gemmatimonadales bacterium]|nr:four helix bundle protein [Gemmatimonadales bacterium]